MITRQDEVPAPGLSVIVVSWNTRDEISKCISSLVRHAGSTRLELIVVDNASTDGTAAHIEEAFPEVKLIRNSGNAGFGRACNQGMARAQGELLLLLNSDAFVQGEVLTRSVNWMKEHKEIGMVGCEVRTIADRRVYTANRSLSVWRSLFEDLWLYKLVPERRRAEVLLGGYWEEYRAVEVDWLAGVFMLLRRELFQSSGGFDSRFFMYGEDSEWCMRLRRRGGRIAYVPDLGVVRHTGASSSENVWSERERLRRCHKGGLEAYAMVNGPIVAFAYRLARLFGATVRCTVYTLAGALRPSEYFASQRRHYGWLRGFYLRPSRRYDHAG